MDRGAQFRESIKLFSEFIGLFDDKNTKNLFKSIGIIVTKVNNDGVNDEKIIELLNKKIPN